MEKDLDPDIIKATQTSLGKYIKRPQLTEKLLKKPPFRFLHDIVTTVLKTTGFFEGLFEQEELISDNVKDRDSKVLFLNKVISVVGFATGNTLSVKSSKIVAGQEAIKTNELLQCLAQALDKKLSSDDAVKKYKEGALLSQTERKSKESVKSDKKNNEGVKKLTSRSNEKLTREKKDTGEKGLPKNEKEKSNLSKTRQRESSLKRETLSKKTLQPIAKTTSKTNLKTVPLNESKRNTKAKITNNDVVPNLSTDDSDKELNLLVEKQDNTDLRVSDAKDTSIKNENAEIGETQNELLSTSYTIADNDIVSPTSQERNKTENVETDNNVVDKTEDHFFDINQQTKEHDTNKYINENHNNDKEIKENVKIKPNTDISETINSIVSEQGDLTNNTEINKLSEPVTKTLSKTTNVVRPASVRPSSSRPGAPRVREKHDNIIANTDNLLVGKVNIIAENTPNEEEEDPSIILLEQTDSISNTQEHQEHLQLISDQHGHLVHQILDSQKEFSQITGKTEIGWQFGAQKAREAMNQEIDQLRFNIQGLSRVANPLGKLMDHIQEDVEVMRQELQQWTNTYDAASKELHKQKTANEDSLFPLRAKLKQLDVDIIEKHDKINDLKIVIHKNSSRIDKLLISGNMQ